jgi:hypothetical protein
MGTEVASTSTPFGFTNFVLKGPMRVIDDCLYEQKEIMLTYEILCAFAWVFAFVFVSVILQFIR